MSLRPYYPSGFGSATTPSLRSAALSRLNFDTPSPSVRSAFAWAVGMHIGLFIWNPLLMPGGHIQEEPALMQVEFRDKMPEIAQVPVKKDLPKPVAKKAKKAGIALSKPAPIPTRIVKHPSKPAPAPLPKTRASQVKIPKFVPRASDEDVVASINRPMKIAATPAPRAASQAPAPPKLVSKGIRVADIKFQLSDRADISEGPVMNIPIGKERQEMAVVTSTIHEAPRGIRNISSSYQAPLGNGVGELAGKNRTGYVGAIQVSGAEITDEAILAAGSHGKAGGKGVEIGGPVGDRKVLKRHLPEYPQWAEEKGISAIVKIFFTVRSDGSIRRSVRVVHSSGYTDLDQLAKEALLDWKFSPTETRSSSEEAWGVVTFRFTLA